jgi:hypothetical protein
VHALVVYESFWGNTAAIARAIAEGIGERARSDGTDGDVRVLTTDEATAALVATADLVVAGAPVLGFRLPTEQMRDSLPRTEMRAPTPADVSHRSMRRWLEGLPPRAGNGTAHGSRAGAAFETRVSWSPGGSVKSIEKGLAAAGFATAPMAPGKFVVKGRYGPLRSGELDRAREWGRALAAGVAVAVAPAG